MICNSCNAENKEGSLFCENCGAALEAAAPVAEVPANEPVAPVEAPVEVVPVSDPGKTLSLVSLILGIASLLFGTICSCVFSCFGGIVPMLLGIAAIVLGILGMNKSKAAGFKNSMGLIGMILGIVTVAIVVIFILVNTIIGAIGGIASSTYKTKDLTPYTYSYNYYN